jgi:hypothetical protein
MACGQLDSGNFEKSSIQMQMKRREFINRTALTAGALSLSGAALPFAFFRP